MPPKFEFAGGLYSALWFLWRQCLKVTPFRLNGVSLERFESFGGLCMLHSDAAQVERRQFGAFWVTWMFKVTPVRSNGVSLERFGSLGGFSMFQSDAVQVERC